MWSIMSLWTSSVRCCSAEAFHTGSSQSDGLCDKLGRCCLWLPHLHKGFIHIDVLMIQYVLLGNVLACFVSSVLRPAVHSSQMKGMCNHSKGLFSGPDVFCTEYSFDPDCPLSSDPISQLLLHFQLQQSGKP